MSYGNPPAWRPEREIELIAGTPAGGGQDRPARALIKVLADMRLLDVPVKLINLPGKGGGSAWDYVRARGGDPHVLGISSPPLLTNRVLGISDYDHNELTPLATLYTEYVAFVVRRDSSIGSAGELVRRLGAAPASVTISLATALGTTNHIASAVITRHAGGDARALRIKVFDSARYAVADVLAGHADVAAVTAVSAAPELEEGKLRTLAVTAPARLTGVFAAAPTWSELGVDCVMGTWRGVVGASALTDAQRAFWDAILSAAIANPEWHAELARQFWVSTYMAGTECEVFLDRERVRLSAALADLQ
jgi:putative tricarboxylic transport membrane protein